MSHPKNFRYYLFWILDFLKGSPIGKNLKQIEQILEKPLSDSSIALKNKNLINLLQHATNSVEFYRDNLNYKSINDFPIVNKNIYI